MMPSALRSLLTCNPTAIALALGALTTAAFAPRALDADDDPRPAAKRAAIVAKAPKNVTARAELVDDAKSPSGKAARLTVTNPGTQVASVAIEVRVAESRGSPMSRMMPPPAVRMQKEVEVEVAAGETKTVTVPVPKGTITAKKKGEFGRAWAEARVKMPRVQDPGAPKGGPSVAAKLPIQKAKVVQFDEEPILPEPLFVE